MSTISQLILFYFFSCIASFVFLPVAVDSQFSLAFYDVTNAVSTFNGHSLNNSNCQYSPVVTKENVLECTPGSKLDDNVTGQLESIPQDNFDNFFIFGHENANPGILEFALTFTAPNLSITLYFFNQPDKAIGLPTVAVETVQRVSVPFIFAENSDLKQSDSTIRSIVLLLSPDSPINYVSLSFIFTNSSKIDWVFISEVDLAKTTVGGNSLILSDPIIFQDSGTSSFILGPVNLPLNISLSCTVNNNGSFEWKWEHNGHPLQTDHSGDYWIWTADASRTTILDINTLSKAHSMGDYVCKPKHKTTDSYLSNRTISVALNTVVEASYVIDGSSVIVKCEAYGYLQSEDISLMRQDRGLITPLEDKYIFSYSEGAKDSVSINGDIRGSLIVQLEIKHLQDSDYGIYSCVGQGEMTEIKIINVLSTDNILPPSTSISALNRSPTNELIATSSTSSNALLPIVAGIMGGVVIILIIIVVPLILTIVMIKRKQRQTKKAEKCKPSNNERCEQVYSIIKRKGVNTNDRSHYQNTEVIKACHSAPPILQEHNPYYSSIQDNLHGNVLYNIAMLNDRFLSLDSLTSNTTAETDQYSIPHIPPVNKVTSSLYTEIEDIRNHSNMAELYVNGAKWEGDNDENGYDHIPPLSTIKEELGPSYDHLEAYTTSTCIQLSPIDIHELLVLGVGEFGEVVLAEIDPKKLALENNKPGNDMVTTAIKVAVKKLKMNEADKAIRPAFQREMNLLTQLDHDNIIKLLAVNESGHEPLFMVMEYMENGNLHQFLSSRQLAQDHPPPLKDTLSPQNLLSMAIQIANGLTYLASHNYIHRDVATRNCLVGEDNIVKIADFGLSRHLYDSVRIKGKAKMPIRWMATECFDGKFSQFSDVWAYGVTVWEMYTMAREQPYSLYSDMEVIEDAMKREHRQRLPRPHPCPKPVYDEIKKSCFQSSYRQRATFAVIHEHLCNIYDQLY